MPDSFATRYWVKPRGTMNSSRRIVPGCAGLSFFILMIIDNFDVVRIAMAPDKTDAPLLVDANAVLTCAVASERFQTVAGRHSQVLQCPSGMQHLQLVQSLFLDLTRKPS